MSLFDGEPLTIEAIKERASFTSRSVTIKDRKGRAVRRRPYWMDVGKGPLGKTCGDCSHLSHGPYFKCQLCPITAGPGTDIRKKDDSCRQFEARS